MTIPVKESKSPTPSNWLRIRSVKVFSLLLLGFVMFFFGLGSYPLFDVDEPRYAEAAREMLENGNWITPYFNYELRFDKPVLFYWLIAWSYVVFGVSEFSARLVSALAATSIVGMIYVFGRHWISARFGYFASIILATAIMFAGLARMSITDMTLSAFMTATTLCLFMAAHRDLRWWLAAGAFAGLGILTKGPVALVVPGAILFFYAWAIGAFRRVLVNRWLPLALGVCALVALPWYVAAYLQNGPIFLDMLFLHNVTRYSDVVSGHQKAWFFYFIVLPVGFLPWTAYLPAAVRDWWIQYRQHHRELVAQQDTPYLISLFALVWIGFIFVFFSISNTKLLTYILPLFPALALLTAEAWEAESIRALNTQKPASRWYTVPAWILVAAVTLAGLAFVTSMDKLLPREAQGIAANIYNLYAVLALVAGTTLSAWLINRRNMAPALVAQGATMAIVGLIAMIGIIPNISQATQGDMLTFLARTHQQPLVIYELQRPSLTFYGRRRIERFTADTQAEMIATFQQHGQQHGTTFVITKNHHVAPFTDSLPASLQVELLEQSPRHSLLSVQAAPPSK